MKMQYSADIIRYKTMTNSELNATFSLEGLFTPDDVFLTYSDIDRGIVGSAVPVEKDLTLPVHKELAAAFFCERREVGIINIGGPGTVTCDGTSHALAKLDSLYLGRGTKEVTFTSASKTNPAKFYFVSYPAHTEYKTTFVPKEKANRLDLGAQSGCNKRVIYQLIRPGIVETCQIVMGVTLLEEGSVWNTFPPHTHKRRSEFYMYFDMAPETRVFHFMGEADNMRPLVLRNEQVALSPTWSMHCGVGTGAYGFIWSMGGENQEFDDMDHIAIDQLF